LLPVAVLTLGWAAAVAVTDGIAIRIGGMMFRSHDPFRPLAIGLGLLLVHVAFFREQFTSASDRGIAILRRMATPLAIAAALALAIIGLRFGIFTAGSADSYGYVSQAYEWAHGELPRATPLPLALAWPSGDKQQTPLGYRPGPEPHTMVPSYAPGLPLMMAASLALGDCGPYLIVPAFGALFVWLTYVWGCQASGSIAGLIAAIIALTSPIVVFQVIWPMTDVPSAALWTAAALASLKRTRKGAVATGLITAVGLLVRPNLPLLVLVPFAYVAFGARGRERWLRLAIVAAPIAIVAAFVARLDLIWYGSVTRSGYGSLDELYSLGSIGPNLARFPVWLWQSQSGWVLAGLIPLVPRFRPMKGRRAIGLAYVLVLATVLSYISYFPFEEWWYLRFMLPCMGAIAVLMATGIVAVARRLPPHWGRGAALLVVLLIVLHTTDFNHRQYVFGGIKDRERRYVDVGEVVAHTLPANALVFAMQHSGGVRFYGGRLTLRYDLMDQDFKKTILADLDRLGYHPYIVFDDWEAPAVREAFDVPVTAPLPWRLLGRLEDRGGVSIYDMAPGANFVPPVLIQRSGPLCVPPRPIALQAATDQR
jgi:hypothetical protein